jgi:hypothetical protein
MHQEVAVNMESLRSVVATLAVFYLLFVTGAAAQTQPSCTYFIDLTSHYDPNSENHATQEEVNELKSYLGDEAASRSLDEIARMMIQREIKSQEENRS